MRYHFFAPGTLQPVCLKCSFFCRGNPVTKDTRLRKPRDLAEDSHYLAEEMIELQKLREAVRKAEELAG